MSFHYVRDTTRPVPYPKGSDPMNLKAQMLDGSVLWTDVDAQGQHPEATYSAASPKFTLIPDSLDPDLFR